MNIAKSHQTKTGLWKMCERQCMLKPSIFADVLINEGPHMIRKGKPWQYIMVANALLRAGGSTSTIFDATYRTRHNFACVK